MAELLSPAQLLEMFEGHRRLTVRTIEAFPEAELFTYKPAETLRPFAEMAKEILDVEKTYVRGMMTGEWRYTPEYKEVTTKAGLLAACDEVRQYTRQAWSDVTVDLLLKEEVDHLFGEFAQKNVGRLWYALENEIHHRGQGYIYLRMLGIEPPPFWER